jgi:hypothetical protein
MFWKITQLDGTQPPAEFSPAGRFVLHRHTDAEGEHLDLRLEDEGCLRGWRVGSATLAAGAWATEKGPHSLGWLEDDFANREIGVPGGVPAGARMGAAWGVAGGGMERVDAGDYAVERWGRDGGAIVLRGAAGTTRIELARVREPGVCVVQRIADALDEMNVEAAHAPGLIADGVAARSRAILRLCGLGRELDGEAFEEPVWRKTLNSLTLDEIHRQLRAFEVRFDRKYPPLAISRPETAGEAPGTREAMAIARE